MGGFMGRTREGMTVNNLGLSRKADSTEPSGPEGRPRQESCFNVRFILQTKNGGYCILLRATDN